MNIIYIYIELTINYIIDTHQIIHMKQYVVSLRCTENSMQLCVLGVLEQMTPKFFLMSLRAPQRKGPLCGRPAKLAPLAPQHRVEMRDGRNEQRLCGPFSFLTNPPQNGLKVIH